MAYLGFGKEGGGATVQDKDYTIMSAERGVGGPGGMLPRENFSPKKKKKKKSKCTQFKHV